MNDDMLSYFQSLLKSRSHEIAEEMRKFASWFKNVGDDRGPMDPVDFAYSQNEMEFMMKIQDRNRLLIRQIHEALDRIKTGDFGICQECGDDISVARLNAQPTAILCVDCKREVETVKRFAMAQA